MASEGALTNMNGTSLMLVTRSYTLRKFNAAYI